MAEVAFVGFGEGLAYIGFGYFASSRKHGQFSGALGHMDNIGSRHAIHFMGKVFEGNAGLCADGREGCFQKSPDFRETGKRDLENLIEPPEQCGIEFGIQIGGGNHQPVAPVILQHFQQSVRDAGNLPHVIPRVPGSCEGVAFIQEKRTGHFMSGIENPAQICDGFAKIGR